MDFPHVTVFDSGSERDAAKALAGLIPDLGNERPLIIASEHGHALAAEIANGYAADPPPEATKKWASELGIRARRLGFDIVVAAGGGRTLDLAKLTAARAGLTLVAAPTQLSHDGICSPVAVVRVDGGRTESLGAIAPKAVFLSIPTLASAPVESVRAGLGDLLANPLALKDWALAAEHGLSRINDRAWDLSVRSFKLVEYNLDVDPRLAATDPELLRRLAHALVMSGMAMIVAGTSRPASGAEHEISHAIDEMYGGRALHGCQVAFGCIVSAALHGDDTEALRGRLERLGLPSRPTDLGLSFDELVEVILRAPDTRPGRFTILENAALDDAAARALVERIWKD